MSDKETDVCMQDLQEGFIFSGNKIISRNHPEFSTIYRTTIMESSARSFGGFSINEFPSWFQPSANPAKPTNLAETGLQFESPKQQSQTANLQPRRRDSISELRHRDRSRVEKTGKKELGSESSASGKQTPRKSRIPDRKTRNLWISKYFQSFLDWKQSGHTEEEKPVFKVSTWTQETVYKFFDFLYANRLSTSSDERVSTETKGKYRLRLRNCEAVASLFERKMPSMERIKRQKQSTDSESGSDENMNEERTPRNRITGHRIRSKHQKLDSLDSDSISEPEALRQNIR